MQPKDANTSSPQMPGRFNTTHWSVVLQAGLGEASQGERALTELCRSYWYPLYAYVRRRGYSEPDAQDLTQSFFGELIRRQDLRQVHPDKGRFRSWLLNSMKHFLINDWKKQNRIRRGGGVELISLDAAMAERQYQNEPVDRMTADRLYDRRWALQVIEIALEQLEDECLQSGKQELFQHLKPVLTGSDRAVAYAEIGKALGLSEPGVKSAVHRLRQRMRERIRRQIMETVTSTEEADDELRYLMNALT